MIAWFGCKVALKSWAHDKCYFITIIICHCLSRFVPHGISCHHSNCVVGTIKKVLFSEYIIINHARDSQNILSIDRIHINIIAKILHESFCDHHSFSRTIWKKYSNLSLTTLNNYCAGDNNLQRYNNKFKVFRISYRCNTCTSLGI